MTSVRETRSPFGKELVMRGAAMPVPSEYLYGIALHGPFGSGKTTTAKALAAALNPWVETRCMSFAAPLREEIASLLFINGEDREKFLRESKDSQHKDYWRPLLQWWGTEMRRHYFGNSYWIYKLSDQLNAATKGRRTPLVVIIDDMRFQNELQLCQSLKFSIVECEPAPTADAAASILQQHSSEQDAELIKEAADGPLPWSSVYERVQFLADVLRGRDLAKDPQRQYFRNALNAAPRL